jgi:hypothetical protein
LNGDATTGAVAVLLATFNGARYLNELEQTQRTWSKGQFFIFKGAKSGLPADNFRFLLAKVPISYEYVAFCDQDDVWIRI